VSPEHLRALAVATAWIAPFRFVLGGSAMLEAHGIPVAVGDLDLVVDSEASALDAAPWQSAGPVVRRKPFCSEWILRFDVEGVGVDFIGGLAIEVGDRIVQFPVRSIGTLRVDGRDVPLADPADWYHLYRFYRPDRAEAIASVWDRDLLDEAAARLGMPHQIG
jgi:hypothetical protein